MQYDLFTTFRLCNYFGIIFTSVYHAHVMVGCCVAYYHFFK